MFTFSFLWVFGFIITGVVPIWTALVILSVPKAMKATKGFIENTNSTIQMAPAMKATAQTNTIFGFLLRLEFSLGTLFL